MVAEGMERILSRSENIEVIAIYPDGASLLEGLKAEQPDVLLLDIQLPDATGNQLARVISRTYPAVRILVVTGMDSVFHIRDMMQQGCSGYILKSASPAIIFEAISAVQRGEEFLEPALKDQLVQYMFNSKKQAGAFPSLTNREKEILQMICREMTNYEIADKLYLSHRTIENHRLALYQKFGVKNSVGLVKAAIQNGMLEL